MVKIISDSTCDLSEELVKRYDITILPLHILLGDEEYLDGVNITPQEIFDWSDEHKTTPKTSAPSAEQAVELLKPYVEKGQEVICFAIASGMSSSMNVMRLAVEELNAENGEGTVTVEVRDQYYNMREKVEPVMHIIDIAKKAIEASGVECRVKAIRGGTDGAQLSFKGLPCPNIFAGGLNFHGRHEFVPVQSMEKAMMTIVKIAELTALR